MAFTKEEATRMKKCFGEAYMYQEPWSLYVNGCGLSRVKNVDGANVGHLDDLCILVTLKTDLPKGLQLPREYAIPGVPKAISVYSKVVGEIKAQKSEY